MPVQPQRAGLGQRARKCPLASSDILGVVSITLEPYRRGCIVEPHQAQALGWAIDQVDVASGDLEGKLELVDAGGVVTLTRAEVEALAACLEILKDRPIVDEDEMRRLRQAIAAVLG